MKKLLSIDEVAELVGLPKSTIYGQRHKGEGVGALAVKIGRHLRWRSADIDRWIDEQVRRAEEGP